MSKQVEFTNILKTVPSTKPGSDNEQTGQDQSVRQARRDSEGAIHRQIDRCARDVAKESSNFPNRSPRTVEMHQVQSIDTVENISVNRQRQVSRTGAAPGQGPGDVRCDATQVPMIQKMQKTVEILQVQLIDKVVENLWDHAEKRQVPKIQKERNTRGSSQTELWTFQSC